MCFKFRVCLHFLRGYILDFYSVTFWANLCFREIMSYIFWLLYDTLRNAHGEWEKSLVSVYSSGFFPFLGYYELTAVLSCVTLLIRWLLPLRLWQSLSPLTLSDIWLVLALILNQHDPCLTCFSNFLNLGYHLFLSVALLRQRLCSEVISDYM